MLIGSFWSVDVMESYQGDGFSDSVIPTMTPETWLYIIKIGSQILICGGLVFYFRKTYFEHFKPRFSLLSIFVGVVGVLLWVGVCHPQIEHQLLGFLPESIRPDLDRPSFNPFLIKDSSVLTMFLLVRFAALAMLVPIVEELFLRGWLVRWIENPNWENIGYRGLTLGALLTASIYGVATHPLEAIAAFLWFGLVTWLMVRTGKHRSFGWDMRRSQRRRSITYQNDWGVAGSDKQVQLLLRLRHGLMIGRCRGIGTAWR